MMRARANRLCHSDSGPARYSMATYRAARAARTQTIVSRIQPSLSRVRRTPHRGHGKLSGLYTRRISRVEKRWWQAEQDMPAVSDRRAVGLSSVAPPNGPGAQLPARRRPWAKRTRSLPDCTASRLRRAATRSTGHAGQMPSRGSVGRLTRPSSVSLSARLDLIDTTLDAAAHELFKREVHARRTALGSPTKGTGDFGTQDVSRRSRHETTLAR